MKKVLFGMVIFFVSNIYVIASSSSLALVDGKYYESLNEAVINVKEGSVIKLLNNSILDEGLIIEKNIEINLNGNSIEAPTSVFEIRKGYLKISGKGEIKETEPNYGVIRLIGSNEPTDEKYSSVYIDKDVKLSGWAGIFVTHINNKSYGVNVYLDGEINAINDINGGTGIGVYINGSIKDENSSPVINILDNAKINSTGDGIYMGGYSVVNIGKSFISGKEAGIGIKSGILNIDGATILSDGIDYTPTVGYSNGINASGTAIQIESNKKYAGNIELNIKNGTFKSENSYVLYEYIGVGNNTEINKINIENGIFISNKKNSLCFSPEFNNKFRGFISGGSYSSNPINYLKNGYFVNENNNLFIVTDSKDVFFEFKSDVKFSSIVIILILVIIGLITFIFFKRRKK